MSTEPETIPRDTVFDLLSSPRRRFLLYYLRQQGGEATVDELTTQIAAWENDVDPEKLSSQQEKRVYVSLYQTHIPKFEENGVVEYDSESGVVKLTRQAGEFDTYLTEEPAVDVPWQLYYLVLAGLSAAFLGLVVFDVAPFDALSTTVAAGAVIVAIAASAVVHYVYERYFRDRTPSELDIGS